MKKKIIFIGCLVMFLPTLSQAAVSVSGVSGPIQNGNQIEISGSGFGNNISVNNIHWLGDNIENGTDEQIVFSGEMSSAGWGKNSDNSACCIAPRYDTAEKHSGEKSIRCSFLGNLYDSGFWYQNASPINNIFISSWTKWDQRQLLGTVYQWKRMAVSNKAGTGSMDHGVAHYFWHEVTGNDSVVNSNNSAFIRTEGAPSGYNTYPDYAHRGITEKQFERIDNYMKYSSAPEVEDGRYESYIYKQNALNFVYGKNIISHYPATTLSWRYANFGGYMGNLSPTQDKNADAWWDDVYISINNGFARVELCAQDSWAARYNCEAQIPVSWSSDTVQIKSNPGAFSSGTAYLYVVDYDGNANAAGYPVVLGTSGGDTEAPQSPSGLNIT